MRILCTKTLRLNVLKVQTNPKVGEGHASTIVIVVFIFTDSQVIPWFVWIHRKNPYVSWDWTNYS